MAEPLRVLVVEDSRTVRARLVGVLRSAGMTVVAVGDGLEAVEVALADPPDVILMDLQLPGIDGIEATARIMAKSPRPIVVLSGQLTSSEVDLAFEALQAGALEVLAKLSGGQSADRSAFERRLVRTLRIMARAKVVGRRIRSRRLLPPLDVVPSTGAPSECKVLAIGASTGGPSVVRQILGGIAAPSRVPILLVQHIGVGFEAGFARWLSSTGHPVEVVRGPSELVPGRVHLAPGDARLVLDGPEALTVDPFARSGAFDSADVLFKSVAKTFGTRGCGALLTGMGQDGAVGLHALRAAGGRTFAQDEASCVVFGMPRAALAHGAVQSLHSPKQMTDLFAQAFGRASHPDHRLAPHGRPT